MPRSKVRVGRLGRTGSGSLTTPLSSVPLATFREKAVTSRWLDPSHGGVNLGFPQND